MPFKGSYLWKLRCKVGHDLVLVPAAVVAVIDADERVLLMERTDTGHWGLPGGSAEEGDTFAATARSEVLEEVGLALEQEQLEPFASLSDPRWTRFRFPNEDLIQSFNLCFAVRNWSGDPRADQNESARIGFFSRSRLPRPMLPMSAKVLDLYDAYRSTGHFQAL